MIHLAAFMESSGYLGRHFTIRLLRAKSDIWSGRLGRDDAEVRVELVHQGGQHGLVAVEPDLPGPRELAGRGGSAAWLGRAPRSITQHG